MKTKIERTESTVYRITEEGSERSADITFKNGIFDKCDYKMKGCGGSGPYNYDDWVFMGIVSKTIQKIFNVGWWEKLTTKKSKGK